MADLIRQPSVLQLNCSATWTWPCPQSLKSTLRPQAETITLHKKSITDLGLV
jgi:hypothetical protein